MRPASKRLPGASLLAALAAGVTLTLVGCRRESSAGGEPADRSAQARQESAARLARLEARERQVDETAWAKEMLAQRCGAVFEAFWDALNAATNKLGLAADFPVGEVVLGRWPTAQALPHDIEVRESAGAGPALSPADWRRWVQTFAAAGWQLEQTEFRHNAFDTDAAGQPRQSRFYFSAHLVKRTPHESRPLIPAFSPTGGEGARRAVEGELDRSRDALRGTSRAAESRPERAVVVGDLLVDWQPTGKTNSPATVKRIDVSRLTLKTRRGEPPFQLVQAEEIEPPERFDPIDPLLLYDLDGDGLSEILLPAENLVYRQRDNGRYEAGPLAAGAPRLIFTAQVADFDGDGAADLLLATAEGLLLFAGSDKGAFDRPGRWVWRAPMALKNVMALTCGDIDHDGDLDLFLGQYKVPTLGAILRPHYYDANDGYPAYLLLNDGHSNFTDATAAAGLEKLRRRRTYGASFVDLDADGSLDLLVVSDFAGVDLYRNGGHGRFSDVTRSWVAEPHAFGMAHAFGDFNGDGRLDFLMLGMNSPTVDRLEHLGLTRPDATEDPSMRRAMTYGNRLYLARLGGGFEQTALSDSIARSGWSWGPAAADFDNDGFPDVYIANGQETKQTVHDFEPEFWLHDIYIDESVDDVTASAYFLNKFTHTRGAGWSYGGYEKNRFYLNRAGRSFLEIGHLLGVALEEDSRNAVADDLDGDGRPDLLVTTYEVWPTAKQTLRIYRNTLAATGHWIGFRFREEGGGRSPVGVSVEVHYGERQAVQQIATGEGFRSQSANTVHFGLGSVARVDRTTIGWPGGRTLTLRAPTVDRYHVIRVPTGESATP